MISTIGVAFNIAIYTKKISAELFFNQDVYELPHEK